MFMNRVMRNVIPGCGENEIVVSTTWEQSIEEQGIMDAAFFSGVGFSKFDSGITKDEIAKFREGIQQRKIMPWWLIGHSTAQRRRKLPNIMQVRDAIFRIQDMGFAVRLVALDYLQIMPTDYLHGDRREKIMALNQYIQALPKEFGCPVMVGCQGSRESNDRDVGCPLPQDALESSSFEHTVDLGIGAWMPHKRFPQGSIIKVDTQYLRVEKNHMILNVWKQRYGDAPIYVPYWVRPEVQVYNLVDWMTPEEVEIAREAKKPRKL
jgi:hypothetical protein